MKRALRINNAILFTVFLFWSSGMLLEYHGISPRVILPTLGVAFSVLTVLAADHPRGAIFKWAFGLNMLALLPTCLWMAGVIYHWMQTGSIMLVSIISFVITTLPVAFNLFALTKLEVAAANEQFEPAQNEVRS